MEDANGQPLSLGSGFFVGDGQIATNLHVVEGAARGYAKLVGKETKFNIEGYTAASRGDGQNLNFAIPSSYLSALLAKPANLQPLYFTKFEGIKLGQPLNWEKEKTATFTFSLQNNHRWDVENIDCLVIFYDQQGQHIGFDIVKYSDRIPAGSIRNIIRSSIFDIPYVQDFDYNGWRFDQKISHLIPFIIRSGGDPSNYNIIIFFSVKTPFFRAEM